MTESLRSRPIKRGETRFRLKAGNAEIIAVGESYDTKSRVEQHRLHQTNVAAAPIVDRTSKS